MVIKKKISSAFLAAILVFSIFAIIPFASASPDDVIYVPDDYATIQAAVNAASPDETIVANEGTYTENVNENEQLTTTDLSAWQYNHTIYLKENSGSDLTDYQVLINLSGNNFPAEANESGADIRFVDENENVLNYWIEEYNYAIKKARIWVKVPEIPANETVTLQMYWGNPNAMPISDGNATFELFDKFEGTALDSQWISGGEGRVDVVSSYVYPSSYGTGSSWHGPWLQAQLSKNISNYELLVYFYFDHYLNSDLGKTYVELRDSNGDRVEYLEVYDVHHLSSVESAQYVGDKNGGLWGCYSKYNSCFPDGWHTWKETRVGAQLNVWFDNSLKYNGPTDTTPISSLLLGFMQDRTYGTLYLKIGKVILRKYTSTEPTVTFAQDFSAWQYNRTISIKENSGNDLTDYQVLINLSGNNFPVEANESGADIRFVDETGSALNYWIEEYNYAAKNTRIWVKVPEIPANETVTLQMYWGSPSASAMSDGDATFEFFDDFEEGIIDTDKWDIVDAGWKVVTDGSKKVIQSPTPKVLAKKFIKAKNLSIQKCELYCLVKATDGQIGGGWERNIINIDFSNGGIDSYKLEIGVGREGKTFIAKSVDGNGIDLDTQSNINSEIYYNVRFNNDGRNVSVKFWHEGSAESSSWNLLASADNNIGPGTIRLGNYEGSSYYDIVTVRKYTSPEPTVTFALDFSAWQYNRTISIKENSGNDLTDYQVLINLSGNNFPVEANESGADIRFVDETGIVLNYWIEEYNHSATKARVWVKVPEIPAYETVTLQMYWGNPGASAMSDGDAVFEFFDDFSGTTLNVNKWHEDAVNNIAHTINNYFRFEDATKGGGYPHPYWIYDGTDTGSQHQAKWTPLNSFIAEWDSKISNTAASENGEGGVAIITTDSTIIYYAGHTDPWGGGIDTRRTVTDEKSDSYALNVNSGDEAKFSIAKDGDNYTAIINGIVVDNYTSSAPVSKIALTAGAALNPFVDYVQVNNLRVRKYASQEPTITQEFPSDYGLVVEWHFDEGSGTTVTDTSGNGNNGTIHGSTWTTGISGKALRFDGKDDYVNSSLNTELTGDLTVEFWMKNTNLTSYQQRIVDLGTSSSIGFQLCIFTNGTLLIDNSGGPGTTASTSSPYNDGMWHHVVGVRRGNTYELYVDGSYKNSTTGTIPSYTRLFLGKRAAIGENYFNGTIDEVRIYNRTLTADEIKTHYEEKKPAGLVAEWHFDEGSGNIVTDSSGNGNDGTIYGATWTTGHSGKALEFDGVDDYVEVLDSLLWDFGTDDFTVSFWFTKLDTDRGHALSFGSVGNGNNLGFDFDDPDSGGKGVWVYWMGSGIPHVWTANTYHDGKWHYLSFTRTGNIFKLYMDGDHIAQTTDSSDIQIIGDLYIGSYFGGSGFCFNGIIDEVCIYNRTLTADEIKTHYEEEKLTYTLSISEDQTTTIGGSALYTINIHNLNSTPITLDLSITGLNESWYTLSKTSVFLIAGEDEDAILNITVPDDCNVTGTYPFKVFADSKSVTAELKVVAEPIISALIPPDSAILSSNDVLFSWRTSVNSTTEVYIKAEADTSYTQVTGDSGFIHAVTISNLTRNTDYEWYAKSCSACGCAVSTIRTFYIDNGIVFTKDKYEFTVERDYDQHVSVSVKNMDSEPHDLLVHAMNPYEDLIVGFVGNGSVDKIISLAPGETKDIEFVIHAQDVVLREYEFAVNLTNIGAENIVDYAVVKVNVRWPNIDFDITEIDSDPVTLVKTFRITNYGDTITDLKVFAGDELKDKIIFEPLIDHGRLGSGRSVDVKAKLVVKAGCVNGDCYGVNGTIGVQGAGETVNVSADFSCEEGKKLFVGSVANYSLSFCNVYDEDESPNTNPMIGEGVESYLVNGSKMFVSQVILDIRQSGRKVYDVNVSLRVWNSSSEVVLTGVSDKFGRTLFTFYGSQGNYSYKAILPDFGIETETRNFSVSEITLYDIEPYNIEWVSVSDSNTTYTITSDFNESVILDNSPFIFKARKDVIGENEIAKLLLQWDIDKLKTTLISGTIENNTFLFNTSGIPPRNYTATIIAISGQNVSLSRPIHVIGKDKSAIYEQQNYTFWNTFPINSTNMIALKINHSVLSSEPETVFDLSDIKLESNNSEYKFIYVAVTNETKTAQLVVKAESPDGTIYNYTSIITLEAEIPELINVTIPVANGSLIKEFTITVSVGASEVYCSVNASIEDIYYRVIWVGADGGMFDFFYEDTFGVSLKCVAEIGLGWQYKTATEGGKRIIKVLSYVPDAMDVIRNYDKNKNLAGAGVSAVEKVITGELISALAEKILTREGLKEAAKWVPLVGGVISCLDDWIPFHVKYLGEPFGQLIAYYTRNWYCNNRPNVESTVNIPSPIEVEDVKEAHLITNYELPWSRSSYRPHDVHIKINGREVGNITNTIPEGPYKYTFDPSVFNYPSIGIARNTIALDTRHMNGGHYVVSDEMKILLELKDASMIVCASNQSEADEFIKQRSDSFTHKPDFAVHPAHIGFSNYYPVEGEEVNISAKVYNFGTREVSNVLVQFLDNGVEIGRQFIYMPKICHEDIFVNWSWKCTPGGHTITVKINPDETIPELDYTNNEASKDLFVEGTQSTIFDTGTGTYPSISGTHNGTIKPSHDVIVDKMYTYPCTGTGGHSESVLIHNETGTVAEGYWEGYQSGDYNNITFPQQFTLIAGETYNYTIKTGSYPQIIHEHVFNTPDGGITCTEFVDVNGKVYYDRIPAIRLYAS